MDKYALPLKKLIENTFSESLIRKDFNEWIDTNYPNHNGNIEIHEYDNHKYNRNQDYIYFKNRTTTSL